MAVKVNLPSVGWSALVDSRSVVVAEEAPCLSEVVALSIVDPCEESLLHPLSFYTALDMQVLTFEFGMIVPNSPPARREGALFSRWGPQNINILGPPKFYDTVYNIVKLERWGQT